MRPVRRLVVQLEDMENKNGGAPVPDDDVDDLLQRHKISKDDFDAALKCTNPSAKLFADKYQQWNAYQQFMVQNGGVGAPVAAGGPPPQTAGQPQTIVIKE